MEIKNGEMKSVVYHNNTEKEALEYTSKLVDFGLSLVISSALNELLTAHNMLRGSIYFKRKVKQRANEALRRRNRKVEELKSLVKNKGFAETYWDSVIDACENDVENLRKAIKSVLDDSNVPNSEIFSQVEIARILLESSKIHFEEVIKDCTTKFLNQNEKEMKNLNLGKVFKEFYIVDIFREWEVMCGALYGNLCEKVDLNDERVSDAFDVLANKFAKGEYIDECFSVAREEFPEFKDAKIRETA